VVLYGYRARRLGGVITIFLIAPILLFRSTRAHQDVAEGLIREYEFDIKLNSEKHDVFKRVCTRTLH
jgi:hypothetical protein